MSPVNSLLVVIFMPIIMALITTALRKNHITRDIVMIIGAFLLFILTIYVLSLFAPFSLGGTVAKEGFELYKPYIFANIYGNLNFALHVEKISAIFALLVTSLWFLTSIYSSTYMYYHHEEHLTTFTNCLQIAISAALGIAFSANLFTLFLFYEVLTLSTFPLIVHPRTGNAYRSSRVYLGYLLSTSTFLMLPMIVWISVKETTLNFTQGGILTNFSYFEQVVLITIIVLGVGKVALMPFHRWLPAAMVAPTPVSALLHAVAVVKAGAFTVIKIVVYIFGLNTLGGLPVSYIIIFIASFTIICAGLIAIRSDNLKVRLAYSTISNLSYIVLVAMLFTSAGIAAALTQLIAHAFAKITLFFVAGAVIVFAHHVNISTLAGIGRKMPITFLCFTIASISLIGMPVFIGFYAKFFMISSAFSVMPVVLSWFIVGVLFFSSILSALTYLPVIYNAYFMESVDSEEHGETKFLMLIPIITTTVLCVVFFFFGSNIIDMMVS